MVDRPAPPQVRVSLASPDDLEACLALRHLVFVDEQGVPVELERDEHDDTATHWVARSDGEIIGTARAREIDAWAKAERVAVRSGERGRGVGRALMAEIERWAAGRRLEGVRLNAQEEAVRFYRRLGYRTEGEPFDEAGIPHVAMCRSVSGAA